MIIHFNNTELELTIADNSYRSRAIMGEHSLTLYFSLPEYIEIPIGAWTEFQGERYELIRPENFKKNGVRNFEYTLILDSAQAYLGKYKLRNTVDRRLKFPYTAKPQEHLQLLVDNLNLRDSGWVVGECVDSPEKLVSYNHTFCSEALQMMADAFDTEWEVAGKTIHLRKMEYNKDAPLALSYGQGNGFKPGVGRSNYDNSKAIEILYVQGGERNIDTSKYKSPELLLPKDRLLEYEGRQYVSDADGYSIRRADKEPQTFEEDSLDCSHIYPGREGVVTGVEIEEKSGFCNIIDNTIPESLDYSTCRIGGETARIIFQSGMLAGREFDLQQSETELNGYVHSQRKFKIQETTIDGETMPKGAFIPKVGDKYAIFSISMPEAYIQDDATQSGASWDMFREAAKYLYENEDPRFSFTGELDGIWTKTDWLNIGGKIKLGGHVHFIDSQFQSEGVLIRIVNIKDAINNPHSPTIELSNVTAKGSLASDLGKIEQSEVVVENLHKTALQFTKRRFQNAQETSKMLNDALLNFSGSVNPITVNTMQLLIGDESLQFRFVDNKTAPAELRHIITYDGKTKVLSAPAGILQHMTMGISTTLTSAHKPEEYKFWDMSGYTSPALDDPKGYYLYAKVSKTDTTGIFLLSPSSVKIEDVDGFYHLLVGVLNSEFDGERNWVEMYGFSELLPGRFTTPLIVSPDGQTYFDIANGEIGGRIVFTGKSGTKKTLPELEQITLEAQAAANGKPNHYTSATEPSTPKDGDTWAAKGAGLTKTWYAGTGWIITGDTTKTTIDSGLITTGTLAVGSGDYTNAKAGITGAGDSENSIRLWAGAATTGMTNAPFRVYQSGELISTKGTIGAFRVDGQQITVQKDGKTRVTILPDSVFPLSNITGGFDTSDISFGPSFLAEPRNETYIAPESITLTAMAELSVTNTMRAALTTQGIPGVSATLYVRAVLIDSSDHEVGVLGELLGYANQENPEYSGSCVIDYKQVLSPGTYRVKIETTYQGEDLLSIHTDFSMDIGRMKYDISINQTMVGTNGIFTAFGNQNYFYAAEDNGNFIIQGRAGTSGFRCHPTLGFQIYKNEAWISL